MTGIDEKLLEERLTALESVCPWTPRLISKLESHIRSASDTELLRINPLRFAADKSLGELETIDLFLHAAALGLFEMNWNLICPICSCVIDSFRALKNLNSHCRCTICPRRSRRRSRRHDRDHLHGQPVDLPDRISRSRDPPGRGLSPSLRIGGGGSDFGWHPLRQGQGNADTGGGLPGARQDDF